MRSRYPRNVAMERRVDRQAWADLLTELIDTVTNGNKSRFARLVGVDNKSITLWLNGAVDVSEKSIRQISDHLRRNPVDMLLRVGYYHPSEVQATRDAPLTQEQADEALKLILSADVPAIVKKRMIDRLDELRDRQRQVETDEVRFWIRQAEGA